MKNSAYRVFSHTVSTVNKAVARIPTACARKNSDSSAVRRRDQLCSGLHRETELPNFHNDARHHTVGRGGFEPPASTSRT